MNKFDGVTLEEWLCKEVFKPIEKAALNEKDFTLHLDAGRVKELAHKIRNIEWIEIY